MAEESFQERTEQATPQKREEARKRGQVARSPEVNSAVVLLMSMVALNFFSKPLLEKLTWLMRYTFMHLGTITITTKAVPNLAIGGMVFMASVVGPIALLIMLGGVGANIAQGGLVFSAEPLTPKWEKISPGKGMKRLLSMRSFMEVVKGIIKLLIVCCPIRKCSKLGCCCDTKKLIR